MKNESELKRDVEVIRDALSGYDLSESAHFVVLMQKDGTRFFLSGGDFELMETCLSEGLARMIDNNPDADQSVPDRIARNVRAILAMLRLFRRYPKV